jgi:hypothetical protein
MMKKWIFAVAGILFSLFPLFALAQTKVVVVPLGDDSKPLKNIITVAKANGNFTDPVAAVNSISNASATNPYLVVIAPGVYTMSQPLVMKPYVDVVGSGENVTKLTGAISTNQCYNTSAIVDSEVPTASLSNLSVENTGGGGCSVAIIAYYSTLRQVNATASGGQQNYGIFAYDAKLIQVSATATGGSYAYGISAKAGHLEQVTTKASGATNANYGISSYFGAAPNVTEAVSTAEGGGESYGIWFFDVYPKAELTQVTATATGGTTKSYGVYQGLSNYFPPLTIRRSTLSGSTNAVYVENFTGGDVGTAYVSQSTLIGGVGGRPMHCVASDDGAGNELGPDCR